jgi:hypothetical protein
VTDTPNQAVTVFVQLARMCGDRGRDLFFHRDRKHPSRAFANHIIEVHDELGAAFGTYYTQHRGVPSSPTVARRRTPACWSTRKVWRALIQQTNPQLQVIPPLGSRKGVTVAATRTLRTLKRWLTARNSTTAISTVADLLLRDCGLGR